MERLLFSALNIIEYVDTIQNIHHIMVIHRSSASSFLAFFAFAPLVRSGFNLRHSSHLPRPILQPAPAPCRRSSPLSESQQIPSSESLLFHPTVFSFSSLLSDLLSPPPARPTSTVSALPSRLGSVQKPFHPETNLSVAAYSVSVSSFSCSLSSLPFLRLPIGLS